MEKLRFSAAKLQQTREEFESVFLGFVDAVYGAEDTVSKAIKYALSGKGKRVRPLLTLFSSYAIHGSYRKAFPAAIATEVVHTYSLIHDDLPCMDDDDLRRGRWTVHKRFDEASALLAGDAMLADAFRLLTATKSDRFPTAEYEVPRETAAALTYDLSSAIGSGGMVLGQCHDLEWTGRQSRDPGVIREIHLRKTGYLMGAASAMGARIGGASDSTVERFRKFGRSIGLAFQIKDDLLDASRGTGKSAGKDAKSGKFTYLSCMSREKAETLVHEYTDDACAYIQDDPSVHYPDRLIAFTRELITRSY